MKNVIFDWSGTLVDDLPPVLEATNRIFAHYEREAMDRDEFRALTPNRELLAMLAEKSGGKLIEFDDLSSLPGQLETSPVPVSQQRSEPWWHRWLVFSMVASLLVAEWGIRRWKGMP